MAYFDNAATTFPKPDCVYQYMDEFYRKNGANVGRGRYGLVQSTEIMVKDTRTRVADLLHCPAKQVVFEPTATIALNIIIQGIIESGAVNIYISPFEHNAVTRVLHHYDESGKIKMYQLSVSTELQYDFQRIRYQFDSIRPDLVIVSHGSNVCGLVSPVEEIFALAKRYGAVTLADMAQTAGLVDCNVGLESFDFAVFAGHKTMYGPTGISGFVMNSDIKMPTVIFGGTGYDSANQDMPESLPERYEMGTLNIAGIAGLNAALRWIEERSVDWLWEREQENRERLLEILQGFDFVKIVGNYEGCKYVGIVSCLIEGISSDSAGGIFSQGGVAVRAGLQCAPLAHRFLGTYPVGTVRFSVSNFTCEDDFGILKNVLENIRDNL
ncbi:aminotransferase class V-fold PLP-dependent enzyme [uncultured Acetatifactor sp.]|uniref:aminotransferase class V-fold PLP-dependent enzyme n=1 Tax=uncultured Acetatifactor sp. TaxID=1671927 RepID=UPI00261D3B4D|nr:aminotransferase class V-fold PLP-dependent enzyme [uncultured Acetatifactor sp.]